MADNIVIEFPSSYRWLNVIDLICGEIAEEMGFSRQALNEISISVIEACTNALEHGNKCCPESNVKAVFHSLPERLSVEVFDFGEGFDFEDYLRHIPDPSNIDQKRGRGIYIMQEMMDSLSFEKQPDRGMKVTLEKRLNGKAKTTDD
ncbi:MAG: ATP-binding protein [Candidatus Krumholzibacteriota bacterium]|nr:ATP-binding protein [Candidatus Krumholzibacteriota bacterium]